MLSLFWKKSGDALAFLEQKSKSIPEKAKHCFFHFTPPPKERSIFFPYVFFFLKKRHTESRKRWMLLLFWNQKSESIKKERYTEIIGERDMCRDTRRKCFRFWARGNSKILCFSGGANEYSVFLGDRKRARRRNWERDIWK